MRDGRRLQSRFESRKTTVLEMRWGTWALWHWSLMIDENFPKTYYEVRDITVNACIIDFTKPQIWAMVNQCAKTNLVPDCKPPAIAAKQRTTVGKVLCYCKYYKPLFRNYGSYHFTNLPFFLLQEVLVATHVSRMKKKWVGVPPERQDLLTFSPNNVFLL